MPINATTLAREIEAALKKSPIGTFPTKTSISSAPGGDGTAAVSSTSQSSPVYMDAKLAKVIANGVAEAVVGHLLKNAVITGGGTLGPGKIT